MHRNPTMRQPAVLTPRLIEYLERVTDRVRAWRRCHACGYHGPNSKNLDGTQVSCAACRADLTRPAAPTPVVGVDLGCGKLTDVTAYVTTTYARGLATSSPRLAPRLVPYIMAGTSCETIGNPELPDPLRRADCPRCHKVDVHLRTGPSEMWELVCRCGRKASFSPEWIRDAGWAFLRESLEAVFA